MAYEHGGDVPYYYNQLSEKGYSPEDDIAREELKRFLAKRFLGVASITENSFPQPNKPTGYKIQTGGHTISPSTARILNEYFGTSLTSREWGRLIEALKEANGYDPRYHGNIWSEGDYSTTENALIDNIGSYIP